MTRNISGEKPVPEREYSTARDRLKALQVQRLQEPLSKV